MELPIACNFGGSLTPENAAAMNRQDGIWEMVLWNFRRGTRDDCLRATDQSRIYAIRIWRGIGGLFLQPGRNKQGKVQGDLRDGGQIDAQGTVAILLT